MHTKLRLEMRNKAQLLRKITSLAISLAQLGQCLQKFGGKVQDMRFYRSVMLMKYTRCSVYQIEQSS